MLIKKESNAEIQYPDYFEHTTSRSMRIKSMAVGVSIAGLLISGCTAGKNSEKHKADSKAQETSVTNKIKKPIDTNKKKLIKETVNKQPVIKDKKDKKDKGIKINSMGNDKPPVLMGVVAPVSKIQIPHAKKEKDSDHDGIVDSKDKCPNQKEDKNGYRDNDGCPDAHLRNRLRGGRRRPLRPITKK